MKSKILAGLALLALAMPGAHAQKVVRIGVATSGGTTLPALVISQRKLDEKHGLKIDWVRLDQAALQKAFALRQFDVSFAEVASDLIRQRARGDKVKSVYAGIMANVYMVTKKDSPRSEEHTSELQSLAYLVCRLLREKKKNQSAKDRAGPSYHSAIFPGLLPAHPASPYNISHDSHHVTFIIHTSLLCPQYCYAFAAAL